MYNSIPSLSHICNYSFYIGARSFHRMLQSEVKDSAKSVVTDERSEHVYNDGRLCFLRHSRDEVSMERDGVFS